MIQQPTPFRQSGFSLLEVIVAFLVFALIASVTLAIVSRGLTGAEQNARYQHALLLAESLLDRAAVEQPAPGSRFEGTTPDGFRWTLEARPEPELDGPRMRLLRVRAEIGFEPDRSVSLQTLIPAHP